MYARALYTTFALIGASIWAIYWMCVRIGPHDIATYNSLVQNKRGARAISAFQNHPARGLRYDVQKDLWLQNEMQHVQINSSQSELFLTQNKDKIELLERLQNVRCHLEDNILTAEEGTYTFPSNQFALQKNCRILQKENVIEGPSIHIDLAKELLVYENPQGRFPSANCNLRAGQLIWHKKEERLALLDRVKIEEPGHFTLTADAGDVALEQLTPKQLCLSDHVQFVGLIQDKESFALADCATYCPKDKTLVLKSNPKGIFWQEGFSLSAAEITIRDQQTVEGRGDVHFALDLEEQNSIDNLIQSYL